MQSYRFFVRDIRRPAPERYTVIVSSARRALEWAHKHLEASPHHVAVDVYEGDELVARLERHGQA